MNICGRKGLLEVGEGWNYKNHRVLLKYKSRKARETLEGFEGRDKELALLPEADTTQQE